MGRIITLTSDFGLADEFVGVMKGVIMGREPTAILIDLSHQIEAHDIRQAAFMLANAWKYFPAGTIHLAVVDPGVGSGRRVILLEREGHFFLAPDNGLLSLIGTGSRAPRIWEVTRESLFPDRVGSTFHGRDIFAPVAASLAGGLEPELVGRPLTRDKLKIFDDLQPGLGAGGIVGRVVTVDRFGNLVTNIGREMLGEFQGGDACDSLQISCGGSTISGLSETFGSKASGQLLALIGSRDTLELAINQGRASERLKAGVGSVVEITKDLF